MRTLLFALLLLQTVSAAATNFYVDGATTSSTQNGTLANPWKTITQVNNNMGLFNPGDVISFKRGATYPGQLNVERSGTAQSPITFNAYGTGTAPTFTGTGSAIWYLIYMNNRSYLTFDGFNITDPALSPTDHSQLARIQRVFYIDGSSNNILIKKCSISLAGVGVFLVGSNNTIDSCTIENLRMVVNTPGGYDDYGANPIMITSSNNKITHNTFRDCWAPSYDYNYDGGALEIYGSSVNNNFIAYNTMVNNCGLIEIASSNSGTCSGTIFAYNKLINNGGIFFIHNQTINVTNLQFYNNVIIETEIAKMPDNYIAAMMSTSSASNIVVMKNNIFWLSTGIDVARSGQFTGSQMVHEDNIYRLGTNSVLNFTATASEMVTTANNIFTNTSSSDPATWNLSPVATGPAIDFGQNVGIAKDFAGNPVPSVPNAGLFESGVTQPTALTVNATSGSILCSGGTAVVTVTATGGTAPYTGTGTFTVSAGTYTYTVSDAAGVSASKSITVTQPAALSMSLSAGTITSTGGTTTVTAIASGGAGNFTYKLNSGNYQSSPNFSGVAAGTHTVTVKDANQCTTTKTVTITQAANNMVVNATAPMISCFGGTTTVSVTASGGSSPYSGTGSYTVSAGTYNYTVTDATGNSKTASITVAQPVALSASVSAAAIQVPGGVTAINVSASGGTAPYTYKLMNGAYQSAASFVNISAGDYIVTIQDAKGCTITRNITIVPATASTLAISAVPGSISCNGGSTMVNVTGSGGVQPYSGTGSFSRQAGTYSFTITDAAGTSKSTTITINEPSAIAISLQANPIVNVGGVTSIVVTATGGVGNYRYKKNSGTYGNSNVLGNISAGTYTISVKDGNGCIAKKTIVIAQPGSGSSLTASSSAGVIACNGGTTTVTVSASGGKAPYSGTGSFTVGAGTYTYTVTDANGTSRTTSITVSQPQSISASVSTGAVSGGTATATASAAGGTSPYTFKLNNGTYQSSATFNNVAVGNHTITVKDARGCTFAKSFTVSNQGLQIKLVSKSDNSCRFTWDGSITVAGTGGTAPYYYQIAAYGFGSTSTFVNLGPGTYTLQVRDATGATASMNVQILASNASCAGRASNPIVGRASTEEAAVKGFSIAAFPNPTSGSFQLEIENAIEERSLITIMNLQGKIVEQASATGSKRLMLGGKLSAGVYIARVQSGSTMKTLKIVKTQ